MSVGTLSRLLLLQQEVTRMDIESLGKEDFVRHSRRVMAVRGRKGKQLA